MVFRLSCTGVFFRSGSYAILVQGTASYSSVILLFVYCMFRLMISIQSICCSLDLISSAAFDWVLCSLLRACRLKKKAQHEANKIQLSGLGEEHSKSIYQL